MRMHQEQYHEELKKELEGTTTHYRPTPKPLVNSFESDNNNKNVDENDDVSAHDDDDNSLQQWEKDEENRFTVMMSRKKRKLYEAIMIGKQIKKANVDILVTRKRNIQKGKKMPSD
ncbi:uncharacterized protein [Rutidosis leptorrhynchoides]|uniref:uncharacterized protein n=1 Tax=Rutidosis leptorrhynchoides TaxID=125765 RepID=UPI003A9A1DAE